LAGGFETGDPRPRWRSARPDPHNHSGLEGRSIFQVLKLPFDFQAIYDGGSRTEAARIGGVGLQTVRDWVLAFNAEGPCNLVNGKAPGNSPLLSDAHRQVLMLRKQQVPPKQSNPT
jgi:Winged helix-turn helix